MIQTTIIGNNESFCSVGCLLPSVKQYHHYMFNFPYQEQLKLFWVTPKPI